MKTISSATHTRAYCWYLLIFLTANFFALLGTEREGERERQGEAGRGRESQESQGGLRRRYDLLHVRYDLLHVRYD
jgi:hypothetical protein